LDVEEYQNNICSSKKRKKRVEGGRLYFTNRKKSGGIWMRSRVLKRSIEDVGDTVKTLFAIQEEVVLETQVQ
jgi:hypothetical protein